MNTVPQPEKQYAVIGDPVAHSRSPQMHNAAFRKLGLSARYFAVRVAKEDLGAFVEDAKKHLAGFNVTVPHKQNILPFLDEIENAARLAQSVNTVKIRPDGTLYGCSTDGYGFEKAVQAEGGPALSGGVICFIGCGGVVPALACHAAAAGAKEIRIVNRTPEKAEDLARRIAEGFPLLRTAGASLEEAGEMLRGATLTVQCTSLGLKDDDPPPCDPGLLSPETFFFDLIYRETAMLRQARERGLRCGNGLDMLLYQGAESFRIWTGLEAPVEAMREGLAQD